MTTPKSICPVNIRIIPARNHLRSIKTIWEKKGSQDSQDPRHENPKKSTDQLCLAAEKTLLRLDVGSHTLRRPNANMGLRQSAILTSSTKPISDQLQSIQEKNDFGFLPGRRPRTRRKMAGQLCRANEKTVLRLDVGSKTQRRPNANTYKRQKGPEFWQAGKEPSQAGTLRLSCVHYTLNTDIQLF